MRRISILWADDEIELLKPHIIFLTEKGYDVVPVNNGAEAVEQVESNYFDIVFLDEQMPGITGIDALNQIKAIKPDVPVVMITKSEEEHIMEAAIGSKISDYLIKPVNPNQILLSLKKNLKNKELISQKTTSDYQSEFSKLGMLINECESWNDWVDVYKKIVFWELELEKNSGETMDEVLKMQKIEANSNFSKFIKESYIDWLNDEIENAPLFSPSVIRNTVAPLLREDKKVVLLVIDNLRYDQWLGIRPLIGEYFNIMQDDLYSSILPTTTQYARNALFAGLMPSEIEKIYPDLWLDDTDEGSKNQYEEELCKLNLKRLGLSDKIFFEKVTAVTAGKRLKDKISNIESSQLSVIVYNFVDTLSHARTEMEVIKELASDEAAYRSLTTSWFSHSPLFDVIKELSRKDVHLVITTDHGSSRVNKPIKVVGDKQVTTNLRYKQGKTLSYKTKDVFEVKNPKEAFLPSINLSSTYIFAYPNEFFAYPNNYNYYVNYYKDTFQHGGISMEEMIIPLAVLESK